MSLVVFRAHKRSSQLAKLSFSCGRRRFLQSTTFHDDAPVEEFLDKHLDSGGGRGAPPTSPFVTSTRREVLSLYRDVWRATRAFTWPNEQGVLWKDVLRLSARKEFEAAQFETDPETIARLLVMGRDAVRATVAKIVEKREQLVTDLHSDNSTKKA